MPKQNLILSRIKSKISTVRIQYPRQLTDGWHDK